MPGRKRPVTYPTPITSRRPSAPTDARPERPSAVTMDLSALKGKSGLAVGEKVRIVGTGLYSGEEAVIERFAGSAIPTAVVRTDAGHTRQVRTIDLEAIAPK